MSENDPTPSKQTSSIPLKKETVRVTLKAADAPPAAPGVPTAPVVRPPSPTAPPAPTVRVAPTAPGAPAAPTAPLAGGAPRPPAPAPTIPLKTAPAAGAPRPAATIPLKTGPAAPAAPGTAPTRPGLPGGGASTVALPKATVQLQPPSQPNVGIPASASTLTVVEDEEEAEEPKLAGILSAVGFVAALVVLYLQIGIVKSRADAPDNPNQGQLMTELMK